MAVLTQFGSSTQDHGGRRVAAILGLVRVIACVRAESTSVEFGTVNEIRFPDPSRARKAEDKYKERDSENQQLYSSTTENVIPVSRSREP